MRAFAVVVLDVLVEDTLEMVSPCDQQPIETLLAHAADETLGVGVRLWRPDRCADDADPLAAEHIVEGGAELAVAVVDEESRSLEQVGEAEVAGLLGDPAAGRVRRAAGEVDAPTAHLEKEQNVETAGASATVSTVKKSQASMLAACWRSNARQLRWRRLGAGSRPAMASSRRTVLAEMEKPSFSSSPAIR
jgi:hypothetical protein